jgi:hypothetical protein
VRRALYLPGRTKAFLLVRSFEQRSSCKLVLIQYYLAAWPHCAAAQFLKTSTVLGQAVEEQPSQLEHHAGFGLRKEIQYEIQGPTFSETPVDLLVFAAREV